MDTDTRLSRKAIARTGTLVLTTAAVSAGLGAVMALGGDGATAGGPWVLIDHVSRGTWVAIWFALAIAAPATWWFARPHAAWALHATALMHSVWAVLFGLAAAGEHGGGEIGVIAFVALAVYAIVTAQIVTGVGAPITTEK